MENPGNSIIIHGPGRSGTTLLSNILSLHPSFFYISSYHNRLPGNALISIVNVVNDIKLIEKYSRGKRYWPRPSEAYNFWNYYFPGFSEDCVASIDSSNIIKLKTFVKLGCFLTRKENFITKITGASRSDVLKHVFNPIIIYIDRDPRAVVYSYYQQKWKYKKTLDVFKNKSQENLIREYCDYYLNLFRQKTDFKKFKFVQVFYEDLVLNPQTFFDRLLDRIGIQNDQRFIELIDTWDIKKGTNEKWERSLSSKSIDIMNKELTEPLNSYGYV